MAKRTGGIARAGEWHSHQKPEDMYSPEEAQQRFDRMLQRMLETPSARSTHKGGKDSQSDGSPTDHSLDPVAALKAKVRRGRSRPRPSSPAPMGEYAKNRLAAIARERESNG